jgi:hypothetical protein
MAVWKNSGRQRLGQPVCNLYSLNAVARFFRVSHNRTVAFEQLSAIFPGHVAPVVRQSADGDREIVTMSWGFVMLQKERAPRRVTRYQGPIKKDGPKVDIEVYTFLRRQMPGKANIGRSSDNYTQQTGGDYQSRENARVANAGRGIRCVAKWCSASCLRVGSGVSARADADSARGLQEARSARRRCVTRAAPPLPATYALFTTMMMRPGPLHPTSGPRCIDGL